VRLQTEPHNPRRKRNNSFGYGGQAMSRILLADDSAQALRLGEQILRSRGLEVVSVTDGAVALRRLPDVTPDLVITDVYLPSCNGFEIVRFMRSQEQYKHTPVIFAAGPADEFEEQDAKNAGADVILRKPFEASVLLGAIEELLKKGAAATVGERKPALDRTTVRAAVTLAVEIAVPALIEELTERVMVALSKAS
jgi:CheY-like chemotaxis protein